MTKYNILINQEEKQIKFENLTKKQYLDIIADYKKYYSLNVERSFYFDSNDTYIIHIYAKKYTELLAANF